PLILQEEEESRILAQVAQVLARCAVDFEKGLIVSDCDAGCAGSWRVALLKYQK
ncbi:hypothetical protein A2U01_0107152, partial [Trifolium medium]|nr:hypothetical protein [Trifolium medium]